MSAKQPAIATTIAISYLVAVFAFGIGRRNYMDPFSLRQHLIVLAGCVSGTAFARAAFRGLRAEWHYNASLLGMVAAFAGLHYDSIVLAVGVGALTYPACLALLYARNRAYRRGTRG